MQALANNFTVNNFTFYENEDQVSRRCRNSIEKLNFDQTWAKAILDKTSQFTRIYVFFGTKECLRFFMEQMRVEGFFSDSKLAEDRYVVIHVATNLENQDLFKYLWDNRDSTGVQEVQDFCEEIASKTVDKRNQWKSLIVVAVSK